METRVGRLWLEAQNVTVRKMVGDCLQTVLQVRFIYEFEVFTTRKAAYRLGNVLLQSIRNRYCGYCRETEGRRQQAQAVVGLFGWTLTQVNLWVVCISAHATM